MRNPFRNQMMRDQYDAAVWQYRIRHRNLFINGKRRKSPNLGSSFSQFFWWGYDGINPGRWDAASKRIVGYAYWSAGRDMAKSEPLE